MGYASETNKRKKGEEGKAHSLRQQHSVTIQWFKTKSAREGSAS